jgi:hypothetical protein
MARTEEEMVVRVDADTAAETAEDTQLVELPQQGQDLLDDFTSRLTKSAQQYVDALADSRRAQAAGEPAGIGEPTVNNYVAFDIAALSPIQFGGPPPYQPSKIVAAGEDAFLFVFMFTNPLVSIPDGFAVSASRQLSGRRWRIRLEQVNLTDVTNGPDDTRVGTFGAPAELITSRVFRLPTPDPGRNPRMMEALVTADISDAALPFAAFASNVFDVDPDPAFLGIPPSPAQWTHNVPLRYLIYRQ